VQERLMLKRDGNSPGDESDVPRTPPALGDDSLDWGAPTAGQAPPSQPVELTVEERDAIDRANEEARRRRLEAYAAMAPATGEYERPAEPKQSAMILLENVTKVYPGNVVGLKDVTLQIDKGEWVFLVGQSGSGKSTMIKLLLKEIDATRGNVIVGGRSLSKLRRSRVPQLRRNIGCVFQDFKLLPNRTVYQNVAYALEVQGQRREVIDRHVPEIISLVGLGDKIDKFPHELSGGQQQRVSIARAFVNRPPLLICDEPTGNLDPDTSIGIMQLLYRIQRTGTTVVMATHDREMVDKMRRRVVALEDGQIVRDDRRGGYVTEAPR
jgi:cell division transport system ATP-binding protein